MAGRKKTPETVSASVNTGKDENKFTKQQLLGSRRFRDRKDLVEALLDENRTYTVKAVEEKIEDYMKGKVK